MTPVYSRILKWRADGKGLGVLGPAKFMQIEAFLSQSKFKKKRESIKFRQNPIVTFGDLHGDLLVLLGLLKFANLIDSDGNWIGKNHIVVQLGDFTDRDGRPDASLETQNPREEVDIIQYMQALDEQARQKGGAVVSVMGNHELTIFFPKTFPEYLIFWNGNQADGWGGAKRKQELCAKGGLFWNYVRNGYVPAILQLGNFVFLHAGLTPTNVQTFSGISEIQKLFLKNLDDQKLSDVMQDIFFTRELSDGTLPEMDCVEKIKVVFRKLGISWDLGGVCVGHTPQQDLGAYCGAKVWKLDLAMSEAFGKVGKFGFMHIVQEPLHSWVSLHTAHSQFNDFTEMTEVEIKTVKFMDGKVFSAEKVKRVSM